MDERFSLVTIIAEAELESKMIEHLRRFKVSGFTVTSVRGHGNSERRSVDGVEINVRIETIVPESAAHELMQSVAADFFSYYSVICFSSPVQVVRSEKYQRSVEQDS